MNAANGAAVTGVRVTDIAFQMRPVNIGPDGTIDGVAPLPLLVPSSDTAGDTGSSPTPSPTPAPVQTAGALHTLAGSVTDTAARTFSLAVADKLEAVGTPAVALPAGTRPFHTLANAIAANDVHVWAAAVANVIEP